MERNLCGKELELSIRHYPSLNSTGGRRSKLSEREMFELLWKGVRAQNIPFAIDGHTIQLNDAFNLEDRDIARFSYFLGNGSRFYLDSGGHPELCTPECFDVSDVVKYELGLCDLAEEALFHATRELHQEGFSGSIELHKTNMDAFGDTWGCHWNLLSYRKVPGKNEATLFKEVMHFLIPFFVTSPIYTGAGTSVTNTGELRWCISQRALFMEEEVGTSTTSKRALFNVKDEPLADREKYRRLHLIAPDHNMNEFAAYLGLSIAQMLVRLAERGSVEFTHGLKSQDTSFYLSLASSETDASLIAQEVSKNPNHSFKLRNGTSVTALEHQWGYYKLLRRYYEQGLFKDDPEAGYKLSCYEHILQSLQDQTVYAEQRVDHLIKKKALDQWMEEQQELLSKKHSNFKKVQIYDWQALYAWRPVLEMLKDLRVYKDLKKAKSKTSKEVMAVLQATLQPATYAILQRSVKFRELRMVYYQQAFTAYHELLAKDVSYHSLKRHPHLWPQEEIGLFHALRSQGKILATHELLPFFSSSGGTLEESVEQELKQRWRQPPPGRANRRGGLITEQYPLRQRLFADWHKVVYQNGSTFKTRTWTDPLNLDASPQ